MTAAGVTIMSFAFTPASLSVHTGTRVTFTNRDAVTHTVTANGGVFNSGDLAPGQSFSFTFMGRGSFAYHCRIHPSMTGTITVTG
jgi:plastocyanin